MQEIGIRKLS